MDVKRFAVCSREYGTVMMVELSAYESELHLNDFINEKKVVDICGPLSLEPIDYLKEESLTENACGKVLYDVPFVLEPSTKMVIENGKVVLVDSPDSEKWRKWI